MILDARIDPYIYLWKVFDMEMCQYRKYVVWANDETHEYGEWSNPLITDNDMTIIVHRANTRVVIDLVRRIVLLNVKDTDTLTDIPAYDEQCIT